MLKTKFSLKQLLLAMVLIALVLATLSLAVQGNPVALGFALLPVVLFVLMVVYQAVYVLLYSYAMRIDVRRTKANREGANE